MICRTPSGIRLAVLGWWGGVSLAALGPSAPAAEDAKPAGQFIEHVVRDVEGWQVHVDVKLTEPEGREVGGQALRILADKLYEIALVLPREKVEELRKVPIWIDLDHALSSMQYHPNVHWLIDHGYDPRMAKAVHIPKARRLIDLTRTNEQPWAVLHELAHAYHDRVLGFDYGPIRDEYERVVREGLYKSVLRNNGRTTRHYALTDPKEYFAEMTEAYFGTNDFYPFVRAELEKVDPGTCALLGRIWGVPAGRKEPSP